MTVIAVHVNGDKYAQKNYGCVIGESLGPILGPFLRYFQNNGFTIRGQEARDGLWIQMMDLDVYSAPRSHVESLPRHPMPHYPTW